MGYVQPTGTDVPVFWDVSFRFTRQEAQKFWLWFAEQLQRGLREFQMQIDTEFGPQPFVCRFLPDSLMPTTEEGGAWGYTATVMARALPTPDYALAAKDLILSLPDWAQWASILDFAVNREMPEA